MLLGELYKLYWSKHVLIRHKDTRNFSYFWNYRGKQWADHEVETLQSCEIQDWFDDMAVTSKSSACKYVNLLSSMIAWGIKRGYIKCKNPCSGVDKVRLRPRGRFLQPHEYERFKKAMAVCPRDVQDIFWLSLLTGARRGNILSMEWAELSSELQMWTLPSWKYKNGDEQVLALTPPALAILERRQKQVQGKYVFPGRFGGNTHRQDVKRQWRKLMTAAKIDDFTFHDLRKTFASYMAINGTSIPIIAQALGHTDHRSTAIYARLNLAPVRAAIEASQNRFLNM